jgi:hypothetical protein
MLMIGQTRMINPLKGKYYGVYVVSYYSEMPQIYKNNEFAMILYIYTFKNEYEAVK